MMRRGGRLDGKGMFSTGSLDLVLTPLMLCRKPASPRVDEAVQSACREAVIWRRGGHD